MSDIRFETVVVIGYGAITNHVLQCLHRSSEQYGYRLVYVEHEIYPFNQAKKYALEHSVVYKKIEDKEELNRYFFGIAKNDVLIVSASNNYLFPSLLLKQKTVTAINFHNALLPKYRGRNAASWVIYEQEKETGVTWHYVTENIDEGNIIIQKHCNIAADDRAYQLASRLMDLGYEAFEGCIEGVLQEKIQAQKQEQISSSKVYLAREIPGNGRFSLADSPNYIYRLLRSMDCGKTRIFPFPVTELKGEAVQIKRYCVLHGEERLRGNRLYIPFDDGRELMLQYSKVS